MRLAFHGKTDVGKHRVLNEDSFLILCDIDNGWKEVNTLEVDITNSKGIVFAVADGMGGSNAGEVASALAVKIIKERFTSTVSLPVSIGEIQKLLVSIAFEGHDRITKEVGRDKNLEGMGTTLVLGWVFKSNLYIVWCGDSRCYIYNKGNDTELSPFTDDHSLVWERVRNRELSPEEARLNEYSNIILQSLGGSSQKPDPEFRWIKLKKNDRILFCSDGLNSMLSNVGLQQILDFSPSSKETCESLIIAANNAGGRDNITSIVADIIEESLPGIESGELTETDTKHPVKQKNRKRIFFVVLLALILVAVIGVLFTKGIFKSLFQTKSEIQEEIITNSDGYNAVSMIDSLKRSIAIPILPTEESQDKKIQEEVNHQSGGKSPEYDSKLLTGKLDTALQRINALRQNITLCRPNSEGGIWTQEFYVLHKPDRDYISKALDIQDNIIMQIAEVRHFQNAEVIPPKITKITDPVLASKKYPEIDSTLSELEDRMNRLMN